MKKAITLSQYQGNIIRALRSLEMKDHELPAPGSTQVLIEIEAAPCNPSDLAFIQGGYNVRKTLPAIPGFEGSGRVIKTGDHSDAHSLLDKRVSFFTQADTTGSWASHTLAEASDCIVLLDDMPFEQAACFSVNPFTAYAMIELATHKKSKTIIQNAAGGQVARFVQQLAGHEGIQVINIVRKQEHIEKLAEEGFDHLLCSTDSNFAEELSALAQQLNAKLAFDAVGGDQSGFIMKAMPDDSTLYLYGALGARTLSEIPATDVIFRKKHISGFNMNEWKSLLSKEKFQDISSYLQKQFIDKSLETKIQGVFKLDEYGPALMQYIRNMSGGKIVLRP
jgi:NADPH:quinone reductase-like Zn-dependent oxidoreductase